VSKSSAECEFASASPLAIVTSDFAFAVGLGYFLRRFSLRRRQFISGAFGFLDGLCFGRDCRSDHRRHSWRPNETKTAARLRQPVATFCSIIAPTCFRNSAFFSP